ncbi:MAG: DUF4115 domain-containing protein [Candidatus Omnitrophica bacterium]|nr:DUF4115 domain-containing protein [Candidatus Omnitrophota bacterium]MDD5500270.1 DUF4115 domain-containing protein [Candidatus Omnitrophota bacterium]
MNIETAGVRLKKIRQERGLSLDDIQKKTKIHINVLRAIEGDSISNLSPIYLKGFIKIYCSCLGLDFKEFIGDHPIEEKKPVLNSAVGKEMGKRLEKKPVLIAKKFSLKLKSFKVPPWFKKGVFFLAGAILAVFLAVKLIGAVASWGKNLSARHKNAALKTAENVKPRDSSKKKTALPPQKRAVVKQDKTQKGLTQGFVLGVFARDKTWVSAKVDGKTVFHGILARGRSETWQAKSEIELSVGDAGALELQVNDQRFSKLGRRGQPLKNIVINKDGLKISR